MRKKIELWAETVGDDKIQVVLGDASKSCTLHLPEETEVRALAEWIADQTGKDVAIHDQDPEFLHDAPITVEPTKTRFQVQTHLGTSVRIIEAVTPEEAVDAWYWQSSVLSHLRIQPKGLLPQHEWTLDPDGFHVSVDLTKPVKES